MPQTNLSLPPPTEAEVDPYRLYAIIRKDLEMPAGKLASQAGHAYLNAFLQAQKLRPEICVEYQGDQDIGTKCCLEAKNSDKLLAAYEAAKAAGIPCSLIIDEHHIMPPHFDGKPIITALGIGPARRDEVPFLKRFSSCK